MSEFSKRNKTKKVVFKKNFKRYYKSGETHYIHEDTVKKLGLEKFGTVSDIDWKKEYREAAKQGKEQK